MSIVVRFGKQAINNNVLEEVVCPPLTAIACFEGIYNETPLPIDKVKIIKKTYYRYEINEETEVFIESENIDLFTKMVTRTAYLLQPAYHQLMKDVLHLERKKNKLGLKWFKKMSNISFFDMIKLWFEIKNTKILY